ncbi:MAG: VWA domain-containing protein [Actinobacteria bacterium]|nr:VWA domain-containing protein [Actinomycetota bacterium]
MTTALLALTWGAPDRWWLLILVAGLIAGYVATQLARPKVTARFTNLDLLESVVPTGRDWKRHIGAGLFALALVSMVAALAHPQARRKIATNRGTVVLAIDTSLSMAATDVSPNRLDAAKEAAHAFLDAVPEKFNVGIVAFHGAASVLVEPTQDRDAAARAVDGLQLGESTAIGEGIFASLEAIKTVPPAPDKSPVPARIVLMSDGATQTGRSNDQAVAAARAAHVPIDTIAFGTDHGTVTIPGYEGSIPVDVDRSALAKIAHGSGGNAYTAASEAEIHDIYKKIGTSVGYRVHKVGVDGWFVAAAFVFAILAAAANLRWQERML